jgi:hypothetical protein
LVRGFGDEEYPRTRLYRQHVGRLRTSAVWAIALVLPVATAAIWIPLRTRLPNTDLALVLVVLIGVVGWVSGARPSLLAAVGGAAAFDLLDTRPYGTLSISRADDAVTALILVLTGILAGLGAARLARYRRTEDNRNDAFAVVMEASGLVATGQDRQLITAALAAEILQELELADCRFDPRPPSGGRPGVARDGSLVGLMPAGELRSGAQIDLPIWSHGDVVGHYRMVLGRHRPTQRELRVALSLADQAGAAMSSAADPDPLPPPGKGGRLRLLRSSGPALDELQGGP